MLLRRRDLSIYDFIDGALDEEVSRICEIVRDILNRGAIDVSCDLDAGMNLNRHQ